MKSLLYGIAFVVCRGIVFCGDSQKFGQDLHEGAVFERDIITTCSHHKRPRYNTCSLGALTALRDNLRLSVGNDPFALNAMELFTQGDWLSLLNHCEAHLCEMSEDNGQLFKEVLAISAPVMGSSDYASGELSEFASRVVSLVGDPTAVTRDFFKHKPLMYDMFFFAAVISGQLGLFRATERCIVIANWFQWLTYEYYRNEFKQHRGPIDASEYPYKWRPDEAEEFELWGNIYFLAFGGRLVERNTAFFPECVWPNLTDD